jgi:hypothetical protein
VKQKRIFEVFELTFHPVMNANKSCISLILKGCLALLVHCLLHETFSSPEHGGFSFQKPLKLQRAHMAV